MAINDLWINDVTKLPNPPSNFTPDELRRKFRESKYLTKQVILDAEIVAERSSKFLNLGRKILNFYPPARAASVVLDGVTLYSTFTALDGLKTVFTGEKTVPAIPTTKSLDKNFEAIERNNKIIGENLSKVSQAFDKTNSALQKELDGLALLKNQALLKESIDNIKLSIDAMTSVVYHTSSSIDQKLGEISSALLLSANADLHALELKKLEFEKYTVELELKHKEQTEAKQLATMGVWVTPSDYWGRVDEIYRNNELELFDDPVLIYPSSIWLEAEMQKLDDLNTKYLNFKKVSI